MDFFIKKIFKEKVDNLVHLQFQKFSKGNFKNRSCVIAKNSGGKINISTTYEYANEFVRIFAENLGENQTSIEGVIISTRDLDLEYKDKKQFMGVKKYIIDKEMTGNEIIRLLDRLPTAFFGLSFKVKDTELKIKPKTPKNAKPSINNTLKIDFCKLKTSNLEIINSLIFDEETIGFKQIEINHDFIIDDIVITDEMKKEAGEDFGKLREMALRKGKIIRKLNIDGRKVVKEKDFLA